jgi:L-aminopeptidase/D-esterase-like protein
MPRLRDLGLSTGILPPGPLNAITDVAGVRVGFATLMPSHPGMMPGTRNCCTATSNPSSTVSTMLCTKVRANTTPS